MIKKFYETLFRENEHVCWSANAYGIAVFPRNQLGEFDGQRDNFFSINPLTGTRRDTNVTAYRNILIEFDNMPLADQGRAMRGIPHTTCVFSGGKSYHYIISLADYIESVEQYRELVRRIYKKLPGVDRANGNPSRFSRAPGALRNGIHEQTLLYVNSAVSLQELEAWLGPKLISEQPKYDRAPSLKRILRADTNYFLLMGALKGEWNVKLFKAAADMTRAQYTRDEIIGLMESITGHLDRSDRRTIDSAIATVCRES